MQSQQSPLKASTDQTSNRAAPAAPAVPAALQSLSSDIIAVSSVCHALAAVATLITAAPDSLHTPASRLHGLAALTDSHLSLVRQLLQASEGQLAGRLLASRLAGWAGGCMDGGGLD